MEIDAQREENSDSEIDIVNCSDSTEDTSPDLLSDDEELSDAAVARYAVRVPHRQEPGDGPLRSTPDSFSQHCCDLTLPSNAPSRRHKEDELQPQVEALLTINGPLPTLHSSSDDQRDDTKPALRHHGRRSAQTDLSAQETRSPASTKGPVPKSGADSNSSADYSPLHYHNNSCPKKCTEYMFDAVLFFADPDRELAEKVKKRLKGLPLSYSGRLYQPRIELLYKVSSGPIMESVKKAREISARIIILHTENFKRDQFANTISDQIMSLAAQPRLHPEYGRVIRLTFDGNNESDGLTRTAIAYREERDPQFEEEIHSFLLGEYFHERIDRDNCRKQCEIKKEKSISKGSKTKSMKQSGLTKKERAFHLPETSNDNTSSLSLTDDSGTVNTQGRGLARYSGGKRGEGTQSTSTTDCTSDSRKTNSSGREADVSSADNLSGTELNSCEASGTRTEQFSQRIRQTENHQTIPKVVCEDARISLSYLRQMTNGTSKNHPVQKAVENKGPDGDSASKETNTEKAAVDGNTCTSSGSYTMRMSPNIKINYNPDMLSSSETPSDENPTHLTAFSSKHQIRHFRSDNPTSSFKANLSAQREDSSVNSESSSSQEHGTGFSRPQIKSRTIHEKDIIERKDHKTELDSADKKNGRNYFHQTLQAKAEREESYSSTELSSGGNNPVTFDDDGLQNGRQPELPPGAPAPLLINSYPEQSEAHQTSLKTFAPVAEARPDSGPGDDSKQTGARSGITGQEGGVGADSSQASDYESISVVMPPDSSQDAIMTDNSTDRRRRSLPSRIWRRMRSAFICSSRPHKENDRLKCQQTRI